MFRVSPRLPLLAIAIALGAFLLLSLLGCSGAGHGLAGPEPRMLLSAGQ
ncbi:MAG TPA: hypothetical protein VGD78_12655 [Chthoniobacterales bacterium]